MSDVNHAQAAASGLDPTTIKAGVAWGGAGAGYLLNVMGFSSWGEFAGFTASIYSLFLIGDWLYRKWKALRNETPDSAR